MGRSATKVFTQPADIARLEHWVTELAVNARVRVYCGHTAPQEGVVTVTPTVQVFQDGDGNEGLNGIVKLESDQRPDWGGAIWLGDITGVEHLDSVTFGSSKA